MAEAKAKILVVGPLKSGKTRLANHIATSHIVELESRNAARAQVEAAEARLAADPAFAANGDARLQWFYERTPFYDDRFRLYPVGREG